jgi:hypothetical protein
MARGSLSLCIMRYWMDEGVGDKCKKEDGGHGVGNEGGYHD